MGLTDDKELAALWKSLSATQREVLLHYGTQRGYSGSKPAARVLVRKKLAEWDSDEPDAYLWLITWTPLGKELAAYGKKVGQL
jgi:hypothetical protein